MIYDAVLNNLRYFFNRRKLQVIVVTAAAGVAYNYIIIKMCIHNEGLHLNECGWLTDRTSSDLGTVS